VPELQKGVHGIPSLLQRQGRPASLKQMLLLRVVAKTRTTTRRRPAATTSPWPEHPLLQATAIAIRQRQGWSVVPGAQLQVPQRRGVLGDQEAHGAVPRAAEATATPR
jgi:hypothetical protein